MMKVSNRWRLAVAVSMASIALFAQLCPLWASGGKDQERVFVIHAPIRNLDDYRKLAAQAVRLKPFGRVELNVSTLADKGFYDVPEGRNFWHEYASCNPTVYKFFPDRKIAPYIPEAFVRRNRELILAKAEILREFGLGAAFWSYEPNHLPEAFFEAYPHMRGARVDHPRRGNTPAFAPCISVQETQEMYVNMIAELLEKVPELHTFFFKTNDAGSGICWSDWQYTGPNGPTHCRGLSMGERVATLMNTFMAGADKAGRDISIYLTGSMFSDEEGADIRAHLPRNCYFQSYGSDEVEAITSSVSSYYPIRGMVLPLDLLRSVSSLDRDAPGTVFISFRSSYDRAFERLEASERFIDLLVDHLGRSPLEDEQEVREALKSICVDWAGEESARQLFAAFIQLDEANKYRVAAMPGSSGIYWGVSVRHINRPLVIAPDRLSPLEEAYFLPYVFNPSEQEARMDYTDIHGMHREIPPGAARNYVSRLNRVISLLEGIGDEAPEKAYLADLAMALKIHSSLFRSIGNFAEAQAIRDRNADKLSVAPHRPSKLPTWEGDPELQAFVTVMRDELDNTQELIDLLEAGGMKFIAHAEDPEHEDTFLLGPDLVDQLRMKRKIMLAHWTDIEGYMTSPFK